MTDYLALLFAALLVLFSVPVIAWLVWRLRRLERMVERLRRDERNLLDTHLQTLIEELDVRGEHLRSWLDQREAHLLELLHRFAALQAPPRTAPPVASQPEPTAASCAETPPEETVSARTDAHPAPDTEPPAGSTPEIPSTPGHLAALAASGQEPKEIARDLRLGVGEVELALRLSHWNHASNHAAKRPREKLL